MEVAKLLHDTLTGQDNLTYDAARVMGVLGALAYIVFWTSAVFGLGTFSATDAGAYGTGLGLVLLAMAGAVRIKAAEEPRAARSGGEREGEK
jgi:hypothetical protein